MRKIFFACQLMIGCIMPDAWAAPPAYSPYIKIDQFGYLPGSRKVAVIADPQAGYNAAEAFAPGTGTNQYQVRKWNNDSVVYSGTLTAWKSGATHTQSGDRGWYFDFSSVTAAGSYYIIDLANNVGSGRFEISDAAYANVLKQALRTFYYQRINFAKQAPYTDTRWADGAMMEGTNQDHYATSRYAKGDMTTAKDLSGGWMDAGDKNKYTTFAHNAVIQLLDAYRINPGAFGDDYNIPESGNGIADILDELKYELDFLKRMQDATGTGGFMLKVGFDNYNDVSPPSTDTRPRYYLGECTSSSIAGCSMFAAAAATMRNVPAMTSYSQDLLTRAESAWARIKVTTGNYTVYQTDCDDGDIKAGDADQTAQTQLDNLFVAAVYLYELTGNAEYKSFAESNYVKVNPYVINWWGPYWMPQQVALLRLITLPGISTTVANNIRNQKANMNYLYSYPTYDAGTDLYRSHMNDDAYHWGHNQARTSAGLMNMDFIAFNINTSSSARYREVAEQYLHWMHGANPMGLVMLSNMYGSGAESSVNEIYHTWFTNGSAWDNALTSAKGPAPGYVPGGPNKNYTGSVAGITSQPPQKAYKDWNNEWPENSWEITEPSIYCQASYVALLARIMPSGATPTDNQAPSAPTGLVISGITATGLTVSWTASTDNVGVTGYDLYQNGNLLVSGISGTTRTLTGLTCNTAYSYYVKAKDAAGNVSGASNTATATTLSCAVTGNMMIYDELLNAGWTNISAGTTVSLANTSPVKNGTKSIKAVFGNNSPVAFQYGSTIPTTSTTQFRFWVYNTGTNGLKVYTVNGAGVASTAYFYKPGKGKWVEVVVSMSNLGNPANITKVYIQNNSRSGTTMYFDDIRLMNVQLSGARPWMADESSDGPAFRAYPNPAGRVLNLTWSDAAAEIRISLLDESGKLLINKQTALVPGATSYRLELPQLPAGYYYLKLEADGRQRMQKIMISQ